MTPQLKTALDSLQNALDDADDLTPEQEVACAELYAEMDRFRETMMEGK